MESPTSYFSEGGSMTTGELLEVSGKEKRNWAYCEFSEVWAEGLQNLVWTTSVKAAAELLESKDSPKGNGSRAKAGQVRDERPGHPEFLHVNIERKEDV